MRTTVFALAIAGAFILSVFFVVPTQAVSYGDIGTKVKPGDSDFVPTLTTTLPAGVQASLASRTVGTDVFYYLHLGGAGDTQIAAGGVSFRLTCGIAFVSSCPTDESAGDWVESGDDDMAQPGFTGGAVIGVFTTYVRYLEADGEPGWTAGDGLYVDVDLSGTLNAGDVRIRTPTGASGFSCSTCPVGRIVVAADTDRTEAADGDRVHPLTTTYATGAFEFAWWDGDKDLLIGMQDVFYLKGPNAVTVGGGTQSKHPDVNDLRLTELSKNPFTASVEAFERVLKSHPDYKYAYSLVTPRLAVTNTADPDLADQHLFLHWADPDGTNNHVRRGDLQIYRAPSGGGGTLVTSVGTSATSPGHGTGIDTDVASMAGQLRYYDQGPAGFSKEDPVYMKRPGNAAGTVQIGDIRITTAPPSFSAGSTVKTGDSDIGLALTTDANLVIKRFNDDGDNTVKLTSLSNAKIADTLGATTGLWETGTEGVYISTDNVVSSGDTRLYHPALASGPTTTVACPGDADCPGGGSDAGALSAYTNIRVTGPDSTFNVASSEYIYDSGDDKLGGADVRVIAHPVGGAAASVVADADADVTDTQLETGDILVVSHDPACAATCTPFPRVGDVFLYGGTFGSRVLETSTGFVPVLTQVATPTIVRYNAGEVGSASDDAFYLSIAGSATLTQGDIRLSPLNTNHPAGTLIKTGDSSFASEVSGNAQFTLDGATAATRMCYIDVDGRVGFSTADPAYWEMAVGTFGAPFGATGTLTQYDVRATKYPASGSATFSAGSVVLSGNNDLNSGQTTCAAPPGGESWFFRYFDLNRDGVFSGGATGSTTNDDVGYMVLSTTLNHAPPPLHAVRITGSGGATSSTAGSAVTPPSGGGGSTPTNAAPVPRIVCTGQEGTLVVDVDGSASSDADGTITSYQWTFGDNTGTSTLANPSPHTYAAAGTYTVTLTVSDGTSTRSTSLAVKVPIENLDCTPTVVTPPSTPPSTPPTTPPDGNETPPTTPPGDDDGDGDGGEDDEVSGTPLPGVVTILAIALAGLFVRRRR